MNHVLIDSTGTLGVSLSRFFLFFLALRVYRGIRGQKKRRRVWHRKTLPPPTDSEEPRKSQRSSIFFLDTAPPIARSASFFNRVCLSN